MNDLSIHAYQGHPIEQKVLIAGETLDYLPEEVLRVEEISFALDYPSLNLYRPGDCTIVLFDPDGEFSTNNSNNFFVKNGHAVTGDDVEIEIHAGYLVDGVSITNLLFKGVISKVTQQGGDGTTTIIASDAMEKLFSQEIKDFGIERHFRLEQGVSRDIHGNYEVNDLALPISKDSVTVKKNASEDFKQVEALSQSGVYDRESYAVGDKGVLSEYLEFPVANSQYPQFAGKTAYRDKDVKNIVDEILDEVGITDKDVDIPDVTLSEGNLFRTERIGFSVLGVAAHGEAPDALLGWKGYPTDSIHVDGTDYHAYNSPPVESGKTRLDSMVLKHVRATDTWSVVYRRKAEIWGIAKQGDFICLLCTDSALEPATDSDFLVPDEPFKPVLGSYDCTQTPNKTYILRITESTGAEHTLVAKNTTLSAQVGYYYIFGATHYERVGEGYQVQQVNNIVPDTHRAFQIHNSHLYYFYAKNNDAKHHGVAKCALTGAPEALNEIASDGVSHLGGNFIIDGSTLLYLGTERKGLTSDIFVERLNS